MGKDKEAEDWHTQERETLERRRKRQDALDRAFRSGDYREYQRLLEEAVRRGDD